MMKIADFDDLNEFNLLSGLDLLSSTRSDRSVVGSHLSEPTINGSISLILVFSRFDVCG
jgi:hypothetical protein